MNHRAKFFKGLKLGSFITSKGWAASVHADHLMVSHIYTAYPAARVINDRVYVFTKDDPDGSTSYDVLQDYFLWSTDNMVNWQDHGTIFGTQTHIT